MPNDKRPDWQVRIVEYVENMEAVKGKTYSDRLLLWARTALLGTHISPSKREEAADLMLELAKELGLDQSDVISISEQVVRSRREVLGGR
jgi:tRNA(Phe) wybutosine-synthesizing methylase Tyw3